MTQYTTYNEAAQSYMQQFQTISAAKPASEKTIRGAGDIAADLLIDKAEAIAAVSEQMLPLADPYFNAANPTLREGISNHFLAQAAAELQIAVELLQVSQEEHIAAKAITRDTRGEQLQTAINKLEHVMAVPITAQFEAKARRTTTATTLESAKTALAEQVDVSATAISQHVQELGGDIAFDLVINSEWALIRQGAALVNQQFADLLDKLREGAGALVKKAIAVARKTLLNVYDKILALLGKDLESQARTEVKEWLDKIEKDKEIELFDTLLTKFYRVDGLKADLEKWLAETKAELAQLNATTQSVSDISEKFITFKSRAETLESVLVLAKAIKVPQVLIIIAGLQLALLTVIVYAGYDYIGYRELRFPNLTQGIGQVVVENLDSTSIGS